MMKNSMRFFDRCRRMAAVLTVCTCVCMYFLAGCTKGGDDPIEDPNQPEPEKPVEVTLKLSTEDLAFEAKGGWKEFTINSSAAWTISGGNAWCQPGVTTGTGTTQVKVMVEAYTGTTDRNAVLTVKAGSLTVTLTVTQKAVHALTLTKDKFDVPQEGGDINIEVKSNINYTVSIPTAFQEWIKEAPKSKAMETKSFRFTVAANEEAEKREGYIVISGNELKDTVYVYQAEGRCLILDKDSCTLSAREQELTVELRTNVDYEVVVPDSVSGWVSCPPESRALRTDKLRLLIGENGLEKKRQAVVIVKDRNSELADTLHIRQQGKGDITDQFDPEFAQVLQEKGYIRNANAITEEEVSEITSIQIMYSNVTSLKGIEYFTALTSLYCSRNYNLSTLDVSKNTALTRLTCHDSNLTTLDVSKNTALTYLDCCFNQLTTLDVSKNTALTDLLCYTNRLTTLDVSKNLNLNSLNCQNNPGNGTTFPLFTWFDETEEIRDLTKEWDYVNKHITIEIQKSDAGIFPTTECTMKMNDYGNYDAYFQFYVPVDWEASIVYAGDETGWLGSYTVLSGKAGTANISVHAWTTAETERRAYIYVSYGDKTQRLTVIQEGENPAELTIEQTEYDLSYMEHNKVEVGFSVNCDWQASVSYPTESVSGWLTLSTLSGQAGEQILNFSTTANTSTAERIAYINIAYGNKIQQVTVTQRGRENTSYLTLSKDKVMVEANGGNASVTVNTNTEYEVVIPAEASGWITRVVTENNNELRLAVTPNENTEERCADIKVRAKNNALSATLQVCQAAKGQGQDPEPGGETDEFPQTDYVLDYQAGNATIEFSVSTLWYAAVTYERYESNFYNWLTVKPISGIAGKISLSISATKNVTPVERKAKITITYGSNTTYGDKTQEIIVTQRATRDENIADRFDLKFAQVLQSEGYIQDATYITQDEVNTVETLMINSKQLTSLRGIEYFKKLTNLYCSHNNGLTTLDVSQNTALTYLDCELCYLQSLILNNNPTLETLYCQGNELTTLDISSCTNLKLLACGRNKLATLNISKNTILEELNCDENKLTTLDVSNNILLQILSCNYNQIETLKIGINTHLTTLDCSDNEINTLDVSNCTALTRLNCTSNPQLSALYANNCTALVELICFPNEILTTLEVSNCSELRTLDCQYGKLTTLNVSGCTKLSTLYCSDNLLTILDVSNCNNLINLRCQNNLLNSLDVSNCIELTELWCNNNQIASLNISNCTALVTLYCHRNQLTILNVSNFANLKELWCNDNLLSALYLDNCTKLTELYCNNNQLTTLDASNCIRLINLYCYSNQIITLNIENCVKLTDLACHGNKLSGTLEISNHKDLKNLRCDNNQLTALNASNCTVLTELLCGKNQLGTLNVSNCPILTQLECNTNLLTTLDISNCTKLSTLECSNNQLQTLDVSTNISLTNLNCNHNQLYTLDASNCKALIELDVSNNQLNTLNVSTNARLTRLSCNDNLLTKLDVSSCTSLIYINCSYNPGEGTVFPLTAWFDESNRPALNTKWSYNNKTINIQFIKK